MIKVDNILAEIYRVWQISLRKTMGSNRGREVLTDGKQKYCGVQWNQTKFGY